MNGKRIIVTGGAGFIGSALVRMIIRDTDCTVLNIDKLTYAGNLASVESVADSPLYHFSQTDIADEGRIRELMHEFKPDAVINLAAESHVDRSIDGAAPFIHSNIGGTFSMLEASREYWNNLPDVQKDRFRFIQVSTDEVYGSLGEEGCFTEGSAYAPRSPYSASKAAGDHMAKAWFHTYGLPTIVTNCSNNYGPYQYPEKLIPVIIKNALQQKPIPLYGNGLNVRDWIHVDDHARALLTVLEKGRPGESYNIGANCEIRNIDLVRTICTTFDRLRPMQGARKYEQLISFVADRAGHDYRYAIESTKIIRELGWKSLIAFEKGISDTIEWYLDNRKWLSPIN